MACLLACPPMRFGELPVAMPTSGVYLFSDRARHLYVGRSNGLRRRYFLHCRPGSQYNQASFAYRLAREVTGQVRAFRSTSRIESDGGPVDPFAAAFATAKAQIREMDYRFVEEVDQTKQALLEAYCAIVLETPHNDFGTH